MQSKEEEYTASQRLSTGHSRTSPRSLLHAQMNFSLSTSNTLKSETQTFLVQATAWKEHLYPKTLFPQAG